MHRPLTFLGAQRQFNFFVFRKGMILPKREDGFFPEMEDLPLLEVTAETGLWYGRFWLYLKIPFLVKAKVKQGQMNW